MHNDIHSDETLERRFSAFHALVVSIPVSLVLSVVVVVKYDLMFLWFFPIYAVSGAVLMLLTLLVAALLSAVVQRKSASSGYRARRVIGND